MKTGERRRERQRRQRLGERRRLAEQRRRRKRFSLLCRRRRRRRRDAAVPERGRGVDRTRKRKAAANDGGGGCCRSCRSCRCRRRFFSFSFLFDPLFFHRCLRALRRRRSTRGRGPLPPLRAEAWGVGPPGPRSGRRRERGSGRRVRAFFRARSENPPIEPAGDRGDRCGRTGGGGGGGWWGGGLLGEEGVRRQGEEVKRDRRFYSFNFL